jgi:hypothetical protein
MDLLRALTDARAHAAAHPLDPAAWAALADVLAIADREARDADAAFQLAIDRWEALDRLVALAPREEHLRVQVPWIGAVADRAVERGLHELAESLYGEQVVAARVWMRVAADPVPAATALAGAAERVAIAATARDDSPTAVTALTALLEGLYTLAERTGRPEYVLRIAGVHLHLSDHLPDPAAQRTALDLALAALDRLAAAGLSHPVQAEVRQQVETRLAELRKPPVGEA